MVDADDTLDRRDLCESCGRSLGVRRYLQDDAPAIRSFCSEGCLRGALAATRRRRWRARRRGMKVAVIGMAVAGACLAPHEGKHIQRPSPVARATAAPAGVGARPSAPTPAGMVRPRVAADGYQRARGAGPRRLDPSAGRADPAHAPHRFARVRRRPARAIARSSAATAIAASIWAARSGASTCAPCTTASSTTSSAARTPSTAASSCASPTAAAPCSRCTSTWRRSRAGSSAACS